MDVAGWTEGIFSPTGIRLPNQSCIARFACNHRMCGIDINFNKSILRVLQNCYYFGEL